MSYSPWRPFAQTTKGLLFGPTHHWCPHHKDSPTVMHTARMIYAGFIVWRHGWESWNSLGIDHVNMRCDPTCWFYARAPCAANWMWYDYFRLGLRQQTGSCLMTWIWFHNLVNRCRDETANRIVYEWIVSILNTGSCFFLYDLDTYTYSIGCKILISIPYTYEKSNFDYRIQIRIRYEY